MNRCTFLLIFACLLLATAQGNADDTYTIKIKKEAKGDKGQLDEKSSQKTTLKVEDSQGNIVQDKTETVVEKYSYQETILEQPEGKTKPTQLRRSYEVAEANKGDKKRTLPYQGKTVLIEKKEDRYQFRIEGGEEIIGKDAEFLEKEFDPKKDNDLDFTKIILPKKPVRVQESWDIETQVLVQDLEKTTGLEVDSGKSKVIGKLVKAYKHDGRQFGVIQLHLEFPLINLKIGDQVVSLDPGAIMEADATFDGCIDGRCWR